MVKMRTVAIIAGGYFFVGLVMFGVVAASQKGICEERARDPLKCRVQFAIPALVAWPLYVSYAIADAMLTARNTQREEADHG